MGQLVLEFSTGHAYVKIHTHSGLPLLPILQGAMTSMSKVSSAEDTMDSSPLQDNLSTECRTEAGHASGQPQHRVQSRGWPCFSFRFPSSFLEIHEQMPEFLLQVAMG